jgi:hypothetical protein
MAMSTATSVLVVAAGEVEDSIEVVAVLADEDTVVEEDTVAERPWAEWAPGECRVVIASRELIQISGVGRAGAAHCAVYGPWCCCCWPAACPRYQYHGRHLFLCGY